MCGFHTDYSNAANSFTTVVGPYTGPSLAVTRLATARPAVPAWSASGASFTRWRLRMGIARASSSSKCFAATNRAATVDAIVAVHAYSFFCTGPCAPEAQSLAELASVLPPPLVRLDALAPRAVGDASNLCGCGGEWVLGLVRGGMEPCTCGYYNKGSMGQGVPAW